ncbi:MAG: tRNA (adenosine(37)-N6)-dimethylallyltransferase MiaA [Clostridium sp.]|nr:tRNA (adenosine(37)-N6)-dimethylallyltransferase MiaA [Clostridium sp.]
MTGRGRNILIAVTGPTGSGKSDLAIALARRFGSEIISADSRQIYRGIPIGTAAPAAADLAAVPHHFVQILPLDAYYSAAQFESEVTALLPRLWQRSRVQILCGGSMMYVDAVTDGIDPLPTVTPAIRDSVVRLYEEEGTEALIGRLRDLDPVYLETADLNNHKRLRHALEVSLQAGRPYSSMLTGTRRRRDFDILRVAIGHPRERLFERINSRVDRMIRDGLEQEARSVYGLRHLNSLNTVGYKEMFAMFDGLMNRQTAIARIAKNTRVYAKKQLTWIRRRPDTTIFLDPADPAGDLLDNFDNYLNLTYNQQNS